MTRITSDRDAERRSPRSGCRWEKVPGKKFLLSYLNRPLSSRAPATTQGWGRALLKQRMLSSSGLRHSNPAIRSRAVFDTGH
jgi:hypothetical protein